VDFLVAAGGTEPLPICATPINFIGNKQDQHIPLMMFDPHNLASGHINFICPTSSAIAWPQTNINVAANAENSFVVIMASPHIP
jgi:hypothetical protein